LPLGAIQAVEEGHDVGLQNPIRFAPVRDSVEGTNGVMGATLGPKAMREVHKILLAHRLQHLAHGVLDQLVLKR